jgi:hypothetical protein
LVVAKINKDRAENAIKNPMISGTFVFLAVGIYLVRSASIYFVPQTLKNVARVGKQRVSPRSNEG